MFTNYSLSIKPIYYHKIVPYPSLSLRAYLGKSHQGPLTIVSGVLRRVVWYKFTNISGVLAASIIGAIGKLLPDYRAQQPSY
jgi:hypothetical protein